MSPVSAGAVTRRDNEYELHAGHDVRYLTSGNAHGGYAGAMRYYTASGEPPGRWAGKGAAALGLSGRSTRR